MDFSHFLRTQAVLILKHIQTLHFFEVLLSHLLIVFLKFGIFQSQLFDDLTHLCQLDLQYLILFDLFLKAIIVPPLLVFYLFVDFFEFGAQVFVVWVVHVEGKVVAVFGHLFPNVWELTIMAVQRLFDLIDGTLKVGSGAQLADSLVYLCEFLH